MRTAQPISLFHNEHGELWLAWQAPDGTVWASGQDIDWQSFPVQPGERAPYIFAESERTWLTACYQAGEIGRSYAARHKDD